MAVHRVRMCVWAAAALAGAALVPVHAPAQDAVAPTAAAADAKPAAHDLRPMFDRFVQVIENRFVKPERLGSLGWRAKADAAWPDIAKAHTAAEAAPLLNALLAPLEISHTRVFTRDEVEFYIIADVFGLKDVMPEVWSGPPLLAGIGAFTATFDGRDHVRQVLEGSPAEKAGIKVGDEIVSVDGGPYSPVAAFRGKAGKRSSLEIRKTRDGQPLRIEVPVVLLQPTAAFDQATRNSARVIEQGGKRIGYVHLWQMRDKDLLEEALATIDVSRRPASRHQVRATDQSTGADKPLDGLVIDNRTKIGGQSGIGAQYLETLAASRGGVIQSSGRNADRRPVRVPKSFSGRSVMLIDGGTRSAAELFAFGFLHEKMGPLIGTKTAGAVTGAAAHMLPGGLLLYVGVADVAIDGQTLEGKGVEPTVKVERHIPYSDGADPQLDAAVKFLVEE